MNRTARPQIRRFALTVAVAGAAALGSIAVAPVASAAGPADGPNYTVDGNGNGPDQFIVTDTGRIPVFFCDDVKPGKADEKAAKDEEKGLTADEKAGKDDEKVMKQHNICITLKPSNNRF